MYYFPFVKNGIKAAFPIVLGYIPIGMAYGLLAQQAKLGIWMTFSLSFFVFAGAAQFIAVSMLSIGTDPFVIISTTFIINFRHLLMSASMAPYLASWKKWQRFALGAMLTDESFAMHSARFDRNKLNPVEAIALNITAYSTWVISGILGFFLGSLIAKPEALGLDFALPAMFIGLLLPICTHRPAVIAALCGGGAAVLLYCLGLGAWAAFMGALVGATAGACVGEAKRVG